MPTSGCWRSGWCSASRWSRSRPPRSSPRCRRSPTSWAATRCTASRSPATRWPTSSRSSPPACWPTASGPRMPFLLSHRDVRGRAGGRRHRHVDGRRRARPHAAGRRHRRLRAARLRARQASVPRRPPAHHVRLLSAGWVLPSLIAPAFAGIVTEHVGWQWVFLSIIPFAVVVGADRQPADARVRAAPAPTTTASPRRLAYAFGAAGGVGALVIGLQSDHLIVGDDRLGGRRRAGGRRCCGGCCRRGLFAARSGLPAVLACRVLATATFLGVDSFVPLAADRIHGATRGGAGLRHRRRRARVDRWPGDHVAPHRTSRRARRCVWASCC